MDPIPLKRSYDNCCAPCDPDRCPQVDLEFDEGTQPDLPEAGTITFRFTRRRKVEEDESETCRYDIKLEELLDFKADVKTEQSDSQKGEAALDTIRAKMGY